MPPAKPKDPVAVEPVKTPEAVKREIPPASPAEKTAPPVEEAVRQAPSPDVEVPPAVDIPEPPVPETDMPETPLENSAEEGISDALLLPSSTNEIIVEPTAKRTQLEVPVQEPLEPSPATGAAKTPAADKAAKEGATASSGGRQSAVYLAALAGGVLGLFSVGALYMMISSEPQEASRPSGSSPFGKRASGDVSLTPVLSEPEDSPAPVVRPVQSPPPVASEAAEIPTSLPAPALSKLSEPPNPGAAAAVPSSPAPVAAPAPAPVVAPRNPAPPAVETPSRPTAQFAKVPRQAVAAPAPAAKPKRAAPAQAVARKASSGPQWVFDGTVYDLLSARGVYGVKLVFLDAEDNEIGIVETNENGSYHAVMKAGPPEGYSIRVVHEDYSGKHIDELDSTSSVRKADLEQRKFLMQVAARSLPWIGAVGKSVRRDMALVPKTSGE